VSSETFAQTRRFNHYPETVAEIVWRVRVSGVTSGHEHRALRRGSEEVAMYQTLQATGRPRQRHDDVPVIDPSRIGCAFPQRIASNSSTALPTRREQQRRCVHAPQQFVDGRRRFACGNSAM
jgi:hypothetical protein